MESEARRERIRDIARRLKEAEKPLRILRSVGWAPDVGPRFLAAGGREAPVVTYERSDLRPTLEAVDAARALMDGDDAPMAWLRRVADVLEMSVRMLEGVGTPELFRWSRRLYGDPLTPGADGMSTPLDLAHTLDQAVPRRGELDKGEPEAACRLASAVAEEIRERVVAAFGGAAPEVEVVNHLSSNALAGPKRILVRRGACFTDRDALQLVHHEAFVHVATALNGHAQTDVPILGAGHAGTTRTQEGLAVFAEMISGAMDTDRLRRLSNRVLAIQMAVDGADFCQVFQWFRERTDGEEQAFENTRRVFRGGVLAGGAPFTKDVVYLEGLLGVTDFLRTCVATGRADCLRLLFVGKLDVEDLPALSELSEQGLCRPPRFVPPWISDLRFLVSWLAFTTFLDRIDLRVVRRRYETLLAQIRRPGG